jgi:hypothetical protein
MTVATIETRDYLTCAKAAEALGLSADSIRRYCYNEKVGKTPFLKAIHVGRDWLIHKSEIARYKKERVGRGRPSENGHKF